MNKKELTLERLQVQLRITQALAGLCMAGLAAMAVVTWRESGGKSLTTLELTQLAVAQLHGQTRIEGPEVVVEGATRTIAELRANRAGAAVAMGTPNSSFVHSLDSEAAVATIKARGDFLLELRLDTNTGAVTIVQNRDPRGGKETERVVELVPPIRK